MDDPEISKLYMQRKYALLKECIEKDWDPQCGAFEILMMLGLTYEEADLADLCYEMDLSEMEVYLGGRLTPQEIRKKLAPFGGRKNLATLMKDAKVLAMWIKDMRPLRQICPFTPTGQKS